MAIQSRAGPAALEAVRAWRQAFPQSLQATRYELQVLLALGRVSETAKPVKTLLDALPAAEKVSFIAALPALYQRVASKDEALQAVETALADALKDPALAPAAWTTVGRSAPAAGRPHGRPGGGHAGPGRRARIAVAGPAGAAAVFRHRRKPGRAPDQALPGGRPGQARNPARLRARPARAWSPRRCENRTHVAGGALAAVPRWLAAAGPAGRRRPARQPGRAVAQALSGPAGQGGRATRRRARRRPQPGRADPGPHRGAARGRRRGQEVARPDRLARAAPGRAGRARQPAGPPGRLDEARQAIQAVPEREPDDARSSCWPKPSCCARTGRPSRPCAC
jgi:hypothetical protein